MSGEKNEFPQKCGLRVILEREEKSENQRVTHLQGFGGTKPRNREPPCPRHTNRLLVLLRAWMVVVWREWHASGACSPSICGICYAQCRTESASALRASAQKQELASAGSSCFYLSFRWVFVFNLSTDLLSAFIFLG